MIDLLLLLLAGYTVIGLFVGFFLAALGIGRIDAVAADSPWYFRVVVLPGLVGLWPVMLVKWVRANKGGAA